MMHWLTSGDGRGPFDVKSPEQGPLDRPETLVVHGHCVVGVIVAVHRKPVVGKAGRSRSHALGHLLGDSVPVGIVAGSPFLITEECSQRPALTAKQSGPSHPWPTWR